ncbi:MAG: flippase-like domain-containing protein [Anaerolineales bacterium]|nr:flippase-like domain-containing protein [Anaerolineales bacterium]
MKHLADKGTSPQRWLRWIGSLLSIGVLIYLLVTQGWHEIGQALARLSLWQVALALLLMFGSRLAVTLRWHVLLRSAGVPIPFIYTLRLTFSGLFASNVLPTTIGGDVFRLAGAVQSKLDAPTITASLIADRLIGMAGMAMALPFSLPSWTILQNRFLSEFTLTPFSLSLSLCNPLLDLIRKGINFIRDTLHILQIWQHQRRALLLSLGWTWVHMLCLFTSLALLLNGLGEPLALWKIGGLWSLVYFVTLIPISINGYGLQEISMTVIFNIGGGISQSAGLTIALLIRLLTMIASLPGALFVPAILSGEDGVI